MENRQEKKWGPFAFMGALLSIASIFLHEYLAMGFAFAGVLIGLYALKKRHERLAAIGPCVGGIVLIMINLFNMGIIPSKIKQDVTHLVRSVEGSIRVFDRLQDDGSGKSELLEEIRRTLQTARNVNIQRMDQYLHGFAEHFGNEFIGGLELLDRGYANDDRESLIKGGMLLDAWSAWYNRRHDELKRIRNMTPSVFHMMRMLLGG